MLKLSQVIADVNEFDSKEGCVTIEYSIRRTELRRIFKRLNKFPSKYGRWFAATCETCVGYHGKDYVHLTIEPFKWVPVNASNLLFISKDTKWKDNNTH